MIEDTVEPVSLIPEDEAQNIAKDRERWDLCASNKFYIDFSEYFMYNQVKPVTERCKIQKLNEDAYYMIIEFENHRVEQGYADLLEEGWFRFVVNANANVVFHFINYRITSIWEYFNDEIPVSYSEVGGAISPQNTKAN